MAAAHGPIRRGVAHDDDWDGWLLVDSPSIDRSRSRSRSPRHHGPDPLAVSVSVASASSSEEESPDENTLVPWPWPFERLYFWQCIFKDPA